MDRVMLCCPPAVAGILGQELLGRSPEWYNVGATPQFMPQSALLAIEFFVLGHFEVKRYQGWNKHKTVRPSARHTLRYISSVLGMPRMGGAIVSRVSLDAVQSGVLDSFPFDPLGQNSEAMQLREIKNGRLAMVRALHLVVEPCAWQLPCTVQLRRPEGTSCSSG
jgi:light-harvesting complex I chlorophyll a/b binding protein 5